MSRRRVKFVITIWEKARSVDSKRLLLLKILCPRRLFVGGELQSHIKDTGQVISKRARVAEGRAFGYLGVIDFARLTTKIKINKQVDVS